MAMALMPERQTLLMVMAGTVIGMPALGRGLAGRDLAGSGLEDLAHDDVLDLLGSTPAFSSAPLMAMPPRSAPEKSLSDPSSRPIGVRAPATITDTGRSVMAMPLQRLWGCPIHSRRDPGKPAA